MIEKVNGYLIDADMIEREREINGTLQWNYLIEYWQYASSLVCVIIKLKYSKISMAIATGLQKALSVRQRKTGINIKLNLKI